MTRGFDPAAVPILIICRDKLEPLLQLVSWLERRDLRRIVLVDNASTYPPLVEHLEKTTHEVVRLGENLGPRRSVWSSGVRERYAPDCYYAVTDCDVIPDPDCPVDAFAYFYWVLARYPGVAKAGFGLRIDDLPSHNDLAENVRRWESRFWRRRLSGNLYMANIDTTFAFYRPCSGFALGPAIRTGPPYVARHHPWYTNSAQPTEEEQYYRAHCNPAMVHWDLEGHDVDQRAPLASAVKWQAHRVLRIKRDRRVARRYQARSS